MSAGYDSPAAAVVSRWSGCDTAATIRQANSLWGGSDSGGELRMRFELQCHEYNRTAHCPEFETSVWAAAGRPTDLNLAAIDFPRGTTLLFTGFHGDKIWNRKPTPFADPLQRGDISGLGLSEFRLWRGIFHCPVPFWGAYRRAELLQITSSPEMGPWTLGVDYDRPIPRRLVEEQGVHRHLFGMRKRVSVCESYFLWPYSPEARRSLREFQKLNSCITRWSLLTDALRLVAQVETLTAQQCASNNRGSFTVASLGSS